MSGASLTCYSPGATDARSAQVSADDADGRWHCLGSACCKRQIVAVAPKSITTPTQPQTTATTATLKSVKKMREQQQTVQQQNTTLTRPCNNSTGKTPMHRHRRANTAGASNCGPQATKRIKCKEDAPSGSLTSASPSAAQSVMMPPSDNIITHMSHSPQLSHEQEQQQSQTELQSKKKDPTSHRLIEKRRRDRMNNCLSDLSKLIPAHYLKKGRGRIEKTEIIEMAIKHLKELQEFSDSSGSSYAGGGSSGGQVQEKAPSAQADAVAGRCESPSALQPPTAGLAMMQSVWSPDSPPLPLAAHINGAVIQLQLHCRSMRQRAVAEVAAVLSRQQQPSPAASGANQHQQGQQLLPQHQQTQTQTQTSARTYHYQQRQAAAAAARKSYSQAAAAAAAVAALNCNAQNVGIRCNSLDSSAGSSASGMSSGLESPSSGSSPQSGNERSSSTSSTDSSSSGDISNELSSTATCLNNNHGTVKLRNGNSSSVRETGDGVPDNVDDGNGPGVNSGDSAPVAASATNCLPIVQSMRHVVAAVGIIANAMKTVTEQVAAMLEAKSAASEDRLAALAENRRGVAINNAAFDAVSTLSTAVKQILIPHQQHQNQHHQQSQQQQKQIIPLLSSSPCVSFANKNSNNSNITAKSHDNNATTTTGNNNNNTNNSFNTDINNNANQNINNHSNNDANRNHPRPPIKLSLKRYEYCKQDSKPVQSKGHQC